MAKVHSFFITASFGPGDVLAWLKKVVALPGVRGDEADFTLDWIKRRATLSAGRPDALEMMVVALRKGLASSGAGEEALLIGRPAVRSDGRHEVPIGIAVMDAATYAELIGQSLTETGIVGVKVVDSASGCTLHVPVTFMMQGLPYDDLVMGFPVPGYVKIEDRGFSESGSVTKKPKR